MVAKAKGAIKKAKQDYEERAAKLERHRAALEKPTQRGRALGETEGEAGKRLHRVRH
jgi:hypothetical protein